MREEGSREKDFIYERMDRQQKEGGKDIKARFEPFRAQDVEVIFEMLKGDDKMLKLPVKLRSLVRTFAKYFMLHDPEVMVSMARMLVAEMQLAVELSEEVLLEKQEQKL